MATFTKSSVRRVLAAYPANDVDEPGTVPAAVALILHDAGNDTGLEALFIKRAVRSGDPWSGQIALPGGRRDPEDADLLATAMRETREETGVVLESAEQLGRLDDLHPRTPVLPPVVVRPFVFALSERPALRPSDEVDRAFWVSFAHLLDPAVRREVKLIVRGVERVFPAYDLGDDVIWGLTERIVTPFLERLQRER
ncbi:MAG TPA: CoA pyrophosphatase [Gemmatimonadales bacterium]|nr:CoA pyrophosphatase [Gemmatimonadales bacterium]